MQTLLSPTTNPYHRYLHRKAVSTATEFKRLEGELVKLLEKIDRQKVLCQ